MPGDQKQYRVPPNVPFAKCSNGPRTMSAMNSGTRFVDSKEQARRSFQELRGRQGCLPLRKSAGGGS